jgi:hypothetical protein
VATNQEIYIHGITFLNNKIGGNTEGISFILQG